MRKLTLTINMSNAAFDDGNEHFEVARILAVAASGIQEAGAVPEHAVLRDLNGNTVGEITVRRNRQGRDRAS